MNTAPEKPVVSEPSTIQTCGICNQPFLIVGSSAPIGGSMLCERCIDKQMGIVTMLSR